MAQTLNKTLPSLSLSLKVNENVSLITDVINDQVKKKEVVVATDNIMIVDVSGSMWDELPKLRSHLKNKVSALIGDKDVLTIIAFSGTGDSTVIFEQVPISTLKDLNKVHSSIDKYLRPTGCTNFIEPIVLLKDTIIKGKTKRPDSAVSVFFLSDGYHNEGGSQSTILSNCKELANLITSFTVCAYGNYADEKLLGKMAEQVGGQLISSERFEDYEPLIEQVLTRKLGSSKKKEITLPYKVKNGVVMNVSEDGDITVYTVDENNNALVPDDLDKVTYLTEDKVTSIDDSLVNFASKANKDLSVNKQSLQEIYAMIYVLAQRMKSKDVYGILENLGDKQLSFNYCNAFGKQPLASFNSMLLLKVKLQDSMFSEGYDLNAIPPENAYCLMNIFDDLMSDKEARWYPKSKDFKYNPIGSKKVQAGVILTDADRVKLTDLSEQLKTVKDAAEIKKINEEISKLTATKTELKFEPKNADAGYSISTLTWNEDRPNLSVQVRYDGSVDLPENDWKINSVDTFTYRNYAIIKDGIVNVDVLPVSLSEFTFTKFKHENIIDKSETWEAGKVFLINLRKKLNGDTFPVINRSMVKSVSAKDVFNKAWELTELQAAQKVFGHYEKAEFPKESKGLKEKYGEEACTWLTELGFTDFNGFSPKSVTVKSGESYVAKELKIAIKSYSSLPSLNAVQKKIDSGKSLTPSEELVSKYMKEYDDFIKDKIYVNSANQKHLLETWLKDKKKDATTKTRKLLTELAKTKFSIILGQTWFDQFDDMDNTSMVIQTSGGEVTVTATLNEVEEKI